MENKFQQLFLYLAHSLVVTVSFSLHCRTTNVELVHSREEVSRQQMVSSKYTHIHTTLTLRLRSQAHYGFYQSISEPQGEWGEAPLSILLAAWVATDGFVCPAKKAKASGHAAYAL